MAYEAFANALNQLGRDIARSGEEKRLHERDRTERLADVKDARGYEQSVRTEQEASQVRLAEKSAELSFNARLKEIRELDPIRARQALIDAATQLGIDNAGSLSPSELFTRVSDKRREVGAADILASAVASYNAKGNLEDLQRNDPKFLQDANKDRENMLAVKAPEINAAQADYLAASAQLNAMKQDDPKLSGALTFGDQAKKVAQTFLAEVDALPPKQRDAALIDAVKFTLGGKATPASARAAILNDSASWAMGSGRLTAADVKAQIAAQSAELRAGGYADRPEVSALLQRINHQALVLTNFGITPGVPLEQQIPGFKSPTNSALAPATPPPLPPAAKPLSSAPLLRAPMAANAALAPSPITPAPFTVSSEPSPITLAPLPVSPAPAAPPTAHWWQSSPGNGVKLSPAVENALQPVNQLVSKVEAAPAAFWNKMTASTQNQAAPQDAAKWLEANIPTLSPEAKNELIQRYTSIAFSDVPPEAKAQQIKTLQAEALSRQSAPTTSSWFSQR